MKGVWREHRPARVGCESHMAGGCEELGQTEGPVVYLGEKISFIAH